MSTVAVRMIDASKVAEARRMATEQARGLGWNEDASARVALVITELATNLIKHAREGVVVISANPAAGAQPAHVQLMSLDQGPGIADIERCFQDGYSTAGSPGTGLGAVRRIAGRLDIFSTPGKGTVLYVEIGLPSAAAVQKPASPFAVGGISVPRPGETVNGDAWGWDDRDGKLHVLMCDGLGHGVHAAQASAQALAAFHSRTLLSAKETMTRLHESTRATRGAAAAVAVIDRGAGTLTYCGIGNITGAIVSGSTVRHLVSHNGILGHSMVRVAEFTYPWDAGSALVMHSDGLSPRWRADEWPGLWLRPAALIAGVLYRDCLRGRDDATAAVVKAA